eukprot:4372351-Amphidinium_carterae.1
MHWTSAVPRHACLTSSGHGVRAMHQIMRLSHLAVLLQMRLAIHVMLLEEAIQGRPDRRRRASEDGSMLRLSDATAVSAIPAVAASGPLASA